MPILNRQQFADTCLEDVKYINVYVSRKKIAVHGEGKMKGKLIDTENPLNKIFVKELKKRQAHKKTGAVKQKAAAKPVAEKITQIYDEVVQKLEPTTEIYSQPESDAGRKEREKQNEDDEVGLDWDRRKKIADAKKAEHAAEKAQLELEKMMGNLIPFELAEIIITINIQNFINTYGGNVETLASIFCDELAGGDRTKLAKVMVKLNAKLTELTNKTKQTAAIEIANAVNSYAVVRQRTEDNGSTL